MAEPAPAGRGDERTQAGTQDRDGAQLPWMVQLDVEGKGPCFGVLLDDIGVVTVAECLTGPVRGLSFPRDSRSAGNVVGVRAQIAAVDQLSGNTALFGLLMLRKLGMDRAYPEVLTAPVDLEGWALSLELATQPSSGAEPGSSLEVRSVTAESVDGRTRLAVGPSVGASWSCPTGLGQALLAHRGADEVLVGLVADTTDCERDNRVTIALISAELPWLVQAAACGQNQQMMVTDRSSALPGCSYRLAYRR